MPPIKLLIIARPFVFHGGVERATAGLVGALVDHGYDVHLLSPRGQAPMRGVTLHPLSLPPLPSAARVLALAVSARRAVAGGGWDVVQSHERTLCQHVYRAGEGCHRAYLASEARPRARGLYHRIVLALERRGFLPTPRLVAVPPPGAGGRAGGRRGGGRRAPRPGGRRGVPPRGGGPGRSRSATSTSRRSRRDCRSWRAPAPAEPR